MKNHNLFLTILLGLAVTASAPCQSPDDIKFLNVFHSISSHDIYNYVAELSADKYDGRLTGAPGFKASAEWVAHLLEEWGVAPGGDNGTYYQIFKKPYADIKDAGELILHVDGKQNSVLKKKYQLVEDYYPGSNSDSGTVTAEVIYAGHGVTAPGLDYDDYAGIDVLGKIVLIDVDVPVTRRNENYAAWVPYCYHQHKLDNAAKHGAAGVLYINKIANPNTSYNKGLVYCHVGEEFAEDIFFNTGKTHKSQMEKIKKRRKPASFNTGKTVTITANTVYHPEGEGCNVIGLIKGTDPQLKEEVIIVGGHLDGVGNLGVVLPGALDNASGIADILGAAKALSASPVKLKRTVMFLFIGGEECGLLGSKFYCEHPVFPKGRTIGFFNLDMVGTGSGLSVGGVKSFPNINNCFEKANTLFIHRPFRTSEYREGGVGRPRSDSVIFKRAGFRAFSFGTFRQEGEPRTKTYYHHPLDNIETIMPEIMEDVSKLMFVGLTYMANEEKLIE